MRHVEESSSKKVLEFATPRRTTGELASKSRCARIPRGPEGA
jgi:hypothetical protein